jgi:hypothetical protein
MLDVNFLKEDLFINLFEISRSEKLNLYQKGIIDFLFSKQAKIKNENKKEIEYLHSSHKNIFDSNQSYNLSAQFYYNKIISKFYNKINIIKKDHELDKNMLSPIFIIGLPRSGSTLIESILTSSEENLVSFGECHVFNMSIIKQIAPKIYC